MAGAEKVLWEWTALLMEHDLREVRWGGDPLHIPILLCSWPGPPLPSCSFCLMSGLCSGSPGRETEAQRSWQCEYNCCRTLDGPFSPEAKQEEEYD